MGKIDVIPYSEGLLSEVPLQLPLPLALNMVGIIFVPTTTDLKMGNRTCNKSDRYNYSPPAPAPEDEGDAFSAKGY